MPICYWCPLLLQSPELAKYMLLESTGKQHRSMPSGKHLFQRTVWLLPSSSCAPFNKMWTVPREIFVARTSVNPAGHLPSPHWCVVHRVLRLGFACCCRGLALDSGKWTLEQQRPFQCVIGPSFVASESRVGRVGWWRWFCLAGRPHCHLEIEQLMTCHLESFKSKSCLLIYTKPDLTLKDSKWTGLWSRKNHQTMFGLAFTASDFRVGAGEGFWNFTEGHCEVPGRWQVEHWSRASVKCQGGELVQAQQLDKVFAQKNWGHTTYCVSSVPFEQLFSLVNQPESWWKLGRCMSNFMSVFLVKPCRFNLTCLLHVVQLLFL